MQTIRLPCLEVGKSATVIDVERSSPLRRRLLEIGFTKGTKVECLFKSPLGDPSAYRIKDTVFSLRKEDAVDIFVIL